MLSHHSQILYFSLQWLIEGLSLHCFNSPHQVWCLPQKDPVPNLRGKVKICVNKLDSNSPLNKELKKNPQTFIDIKYILVNSTIYIFNKKNKNTLNIVFMKEENLYQLPIRSKQGSFASDKRVPGSDSTYIDSLIDWSINMCTTARCVSLMFMSGCMCVYSPHIQDRHKCVSIYVGGHLLYIHTQIYVCMHVCYYMSMVSLGI